MRRRRKPTRLVCVAALGLSLSWIGAGEPAAGRIRARGEKNPFQKDAVDKALERAVRFLLSHQGTDGSIIDRPYRGKPRNRVESRSVAMTSLAVMAIASLGHEITDPTPQGKALRAALEFILQKGAEKRDGGDTEYFGGRDGSRMYGHGITTLMLGEMLGMGVDDAQDRRIREHLEKAIRLILRSQKVKKDGRHQGGWRYTPQSRDSDLSVTVWQVMALRSARNAGLEIPSSAVEEAAAYIRGCYGKRGRAGAGPFAYQPGGRAEYSTASAGLLSLQVCGFYDDPTVKGAADWLLRLDPGAMWRRSWFFYGTYYYAQGMYQRGGKYAEKARRGVREVLLKNQGKDGSWLAAQGQERSAGKIYGTSLGILSLSVKYHYLPIYQR